MKKLVKLAVIVCLLTSTGCVTFNMRVVDLNKTPPTPGEQTPVVKAEILTF